MKFRAVFFTKMPSNEIPVHRSTMDTQHLLTTAICVVASATIFALGATIYILNWIINGDNTVTIQAEQINQKAI